MGKTVIDAVSSLLSAVAKYAAVFFAYGMGKKRAQLDAAKEAGEIKDAQLEIASKPDAHRDTLLERMRKRKRS